jgi:hypothetical protein
MKQDLGKDATKAPINDVDMDMDDGELTSAATMENGKKKKDKLAFRKAINLIDESDGAEPKSLKRKPNEPEDFDAERCVLRHHAPFRLSLT